MLGSCFWLLLLFSCLVSRPCVASPSYPVAEVSVEVWEDCYHQKLAVAVVKLCSEYATVRTGCCDLTVHGKSVTCVCCLSRMTFPPGTLTVCQHLILHWNRCLWVDMLYLHCDAAFPKQIGFESQWLEIIKSYVLPVQRQVYPGFNSRVRLIFLPQGVRFSFLWSLWM